MGILDLQVPKFKSEYYQVASIQFAHHRRRKQGGEGGGRPPLDVLV